MQARFFCNFVVIKALRYIFVSVVTLLIALVVLLFVASRLSYVQRWLGQAVSDVATIEMRRGAAAEPPGGDRSRLIIDKVNIGLTLRPVLENVLLLDQRGDTMFNARRMTTRLRLLPLFAGSVSLAHVQLYGADVRLRQDSVSGLNCQFLIDLFSGDDSGGGSSPKLDIGTILMRRCNLTFSNDTSTIAIRNLAATVFGLNIENKRYKAFLRDLHFESDIVNIDNLSARVNIGPGGGHVRRATLMLPVSHLYVHDLSWVSDFRSWRLNGGKLYVSAEDIPAPYRNDPTVRSIVRHLAWADTHFALSGSADSLRTDTFTSESPDLKVDADATFRFKTKEAVLHKLDIDWLKNDWLRFRANAYYSPSRSDVHARVTAMNASADLDAYLDNNDRWRAECRTNRFRPSLLANYVPEADAIVRQFGDSAHVTLDVRAEGSLLNKIINASGSVHCNSVPLVCRLDGNLGYTPFTGNVLRVKSVIDKVHPAAFGVGGSLGRHSYAVDADVALRAGRGKNIEEALGRVVINNLTALDDTLGVGPLVRGLLVDISETDYGSRRLVAFSDFMNIHALIDGKVSKTVRRVAGMLSAAMPSLVGRTAAPTFSDDRLTMTAQIWDTRLLNHFTDADLDIIDTLQLHVRADSTVYLALDADSVRYGGERLSKVMLNAAANAHRTVARLRVGREMDGDVARLVLRAGASADTIGTRLTWTMEDAAGKTLADNSADLRLGIQLGDTLRMSVRPGVVTLSSEELHTTHGDICVLPGGVLDIDSLAIEAGDRFVRVHGRLSKNPEDTLRANIRKINLGYIFDLVNFHSVELDGDATGRIAATGIMSGPKAAGKLRVSDFSFNGDVLGDLDLLAAWDTNEGQLDLDGVIRGPAVPSLTVLGASPPCRTTVKGRVNPIRKKPRYDIDLRIGAEGFSLGFINEWTHGIFDDICGSVTGDVRIHGPLNAVDITGKVMVDHCTAYVPSLGVRYQMAGDSVELRPGVFDFSGLRLYDYHAKQHARDHCAILSKGLLRHDHFDDMNYDFIADATNVLGYETRDFNGEVFYGTALLTGKVHLSGGPGRLDVDVTDGITCPGSMLVYDSTTPDVVTNANFVTFVDNLYSKKEGQTHAVAIPEYEPGMDMRLNFDVEVTPDATLRVLMDRHSGDYIEMRGHSPMHATYYNKGSLNMYGTYTVRRGNYRLTLQNMLRKDFTFSDGGTISFTGRPTRGTLDMQAVYQVAGVSLNDIAATTTFSSERKRVNCLMNITGMVSAPRVTFDFDIPSATQDELSMVRSLVTTEEERNLQAIYLLGLGTFYAQEVSEDASRGNMAVNSFISSTLSSQLNSVLGDAIGSKNWSFGTNISTGQQGWSEIQAEGMLSGRLFNDRLLLNGTFGYRDGATSNKTGFVGDFDVQWLLNSRGTISLKAYSQTTDRYFTKSSLSTQGIGVILKQDFNTFRELFGIRPKAKKEEEK